MALRPEMYAETNFTPEGHVQIIGLWVFDEQGMPQLFQFPTGPTDLGDNYELVVLSILRQGYIWACLLYPQRMFV